jgi:hypothetical protein
MQVDTGFHVGKPFESDFDPRSSRRAYELSTIEQFGAPSSFTITGELISD